MKKEIIIAAVFLMTLAASLFNISYLERLTGDVSRLAEASADAMLEGDVDSAEALAVEAFSHWQSRSFYLHVVLRHSVYEACENNLILLLTEIYSGDTGRALGMVEAVRRSMESIVETERIRAGSIF